MPPAPGVETSADGPIGFGWPEVTAQDEQAVQRVLRSGWLSSGPECEAFEGELAEFLNASHVVTLSSCTAALEVALASLHLRPGARVGVPTWTFVATAGAVVRSGGKPVLLDIDPATLNLAPESLDAAVGSIDAVIPVHFGGVPVARSVREVASDAGVPVIEDAAHALGASDDRGRLAGGGTVGACFSFYATKNLTSGEGGALATQDGSVADFARRWRSHGMDADAWHRLRPDTEDRYEVAELGQKANLSDILAALGRSQLSRFTTIQARRRRLVDRYRSILVPAGVAVVPSEQVTGSADHLMTVLLPDHVDRSTVIHLMAGAGIATHVHFPPLHTLEWFRRHASVGPGGVAVAERLKGTALSLPLHLGLTDSDVARVCGVLLEAIGRA
ncbi:MAG: DegT/DnrJ/EryC1/StrS family aminotransferase [Microthrixaceae bacterium]